MTHNLMLNEEYIECEDALEISKKIQSILDSHDVFEYVTNEDQTVPVINPSNSELTFGFIINPISNESRRFLSQFQNFLNGKDRIYIT